MDRLFKIYMGGSDIRFNIKGGGSQLYIVHDTQQ